MENTLVNLTLIQIERDLEKILLTYPEEVRELMSGDADFVNKVLAYVLTRIPNRYIVAPSENISTFWLQTLIGSSLEESEVEELIQQGVIYLINQQRMNGMFNRYPVGQRC